MGEIFTMGQHFSSNLSSDLQQIFSRQCWLIINSGALNVMGLRHLGSMAPPQILHYAADAAAAAALHCISFRDTFQVFVGTTYHGLGGGGGGQGQRLVPVGSALVILHFTSAWHLT